MLLALALFYISAVVFIRKIMHFFTCMESEGELEKLQGWLGWLSVQRVMLFIRVLVLFNSQMNGTVNKRNIALFPDIYVLGFQ